MSPPGEMSEDPIHAEYYAVDVKTTTSSSPETPPIEVIVFLFEDVRAKLPKEPDTWGLTDGSIIDMQIEPGEPIEEQIDAILLMGPEESKATHITLVGPLGSSERNSVEELAKHYENVAWYVTKEVYANLGKTVTPIEGVKFFEIRAV